MRGWLRSRTGRQVLAGLAVAGIAFLLRCLEQTGAGWHLLWVGWSVLLLALPAWAGLGEDEHPPDDEWPDDWDDPDDGGPDGDGGEPQILPLWEETG